MAVDTPGMYLKDGSVYKVQISRATGRAYALKLVGVKGEDKDVWSYDTAKAERIMSKLSAYDMMTLEQAKEYGCLYGICCICGARLTNDKSIAAGIGPVCAQGEQFADPGATEVYQTDEYRAAAIAREEAQAVEKAAEPAPARTIDADSNRYGPLFRLAWSYQDDDFLAIKNTFKAFEWNLIHQKWDGVNKVWTASATPDTIPVILGFVKKFNFTITPQAQHLIDRLAPDLNPAEVETDPAPKNFAQLAALVG